VIAVWAAASFPGETATAEMGGFGEADMSLPV